MNVRLPANIARDLGALVNALSEEGYVPVAFEESASFGNFAVTFSNGQRTAIVCRDRGQFHLHGERDLLEPVGLWRSFYGWRDLVPPLLAWLRGAL